MDHLRDVMNPYLLNVSTATRHCSRALCGNKGRCVRRNWDSDTYLHLDPSRFAIKRVRAELIVTGLLGRGDVAQYNESFHCMCYSKEPCYQPLNFTDHAVSCPRLPSAALLAAAAVLHSVLMS